MQKKQPSTGIKRPNATGGKSADMFWKRNRPKVGQAGLNALPATLFLPALATFDIAIVTAPGRGIKDAMKRAPLKSALNTTGATGQAKPREQ